MKICGTVSVEVPACEGFECHPKCKAAKAGCKRWVEVESKLSNGKGFVRFYMVFDKEDGDASFYVHIPGPTCPAHDTVPNPWPDYVCLVHPDGKPTCVTAPGDRPEAEWRNHKAGLTQVWEEKPCGLCPECGRDAWMNKWNIWYCDACGKACP